MPFYGQDYGGDGIEEEEEEELGNAPSQFLSEEFAVDSDDSMTG